jgi:cysteinyl-tRNA synthetase
MSKSLGNFTTIRALLDSGISPMTLRLFVLQAHYRKPLDFTAEALDAAATGWKGLNSALGLMADATDGADPTTPVSSQPLPGQPTELDETRVRFVAAMDDDLNTSAALAVLFELAKPLRALANRLERGDVAAAAEAQTPTNQQRGALLHELAGVLGLKVEADAAPAATSSGPSEAEIDALIEQRRAAKAAKDFTTADAIRAQLLEAGIELIDKPGGLTDWLRR